MSPTPSRGVSDNITITRNRKGKSCDINMHSASGSSKKSRDASVCSNGDNGDSTASCLVDDDAKSELTVSPTSSTTSVKENSVPKKRGRGSTTNRNLMMTYSPKRKRKRPSSSRSSSTTTTPSVVDLEEKKSSRGRGRPPSSRSSTVSEKSTVSVAVSEKSVISCSDTSDQTSTTSSAQRASRRSTRFPRDKQNVVIEEVSSVNEIDEGLIERGVQSMELNGDEDTGCGSSISDSNSAVGAPVQSTMDNHSEVERGHHEEVNMEEDTDAGIIATEVSEDSHKIGNDEDEKKSNDNYIDANEPCELEDEKRDKEKERIESGDESGSGGSESEEEGDSDDDPEREVYVVERIDDKRIISGITYYFIKWKGWHESSNTWEPLKNLDGCSELLKEFEKRYAEKRNKRRTTGGRKRSDSEIEEDKQTIEETQSHMRSYGILNEWPKEKEPISVEGVIHVDGVLTYVVKRKVRLSSKKLDRSNAVLVKAESFRQQYPKLVIKFYEQRVVWCENAKDNEEQAYIASQMALINQNRGSLLGKMVINDVDKEIKETYKDNDNLGKQLDIETQLVTISDEDDEENKAMQEEDTERSNNGEEKDKDYYGLPEDMEETDISSCVSDSEMHEIIDLNNSGSSDENAEGNEY